MKADNPPRQPGLPTVEQALQQAIAHHHAGRLQDAERVYRAILQARPKHPDANHNLGVLAMQAGKPVVGLPHFKAALEANPIGQHWLSYIDALIRAGQIDAARLVLERGRQQGLHGEAVEALAGRMKEPAGNEPSPQQVNALTTLFNAGRYPEAATLARELTARFPLNGFGWKALGTLLKQMGRSNDALLPMQKAAALSPSDAEVHSNMGVTLQELGRLNEAEVSYQRALLIEPKFAVAHFNLGYTLNELGRQAEAEASYQRALLIEPELAVAHCNLGCTLHELNRLNEAEAGYRRALQIKPDYADAHFNLGFTLLLSGKLSEGWQEYEYRWEGISPKPERPATHLAQWTGQTPQIGDGILIFAEQGYGDQLQFSRYLPLVADRFAGAVSVVVDRPLLALFRRSFSGVEVLESTPSDQSAWRWQCPLLSLPLAFNTTLETIPRQIPYLIPDPARVAYWKSRIAVLDLLDSTRKIGVVWQPGRIMKNAARRSLTLQQLAPLLNLPGCAWFSLQKEPDQDKAPWVASGKLIDWADEFSDFDETAALAVNLDLVISVDTAVVHLAGGLGWPTWLFNRHASEWRWMRDREDSPWYPTMLIFAQAIVGDWDEVVGRMSATLRGSECKPR